MKLNWLCPYCDRNATITKSNYSKSIHFYDHENKDGGSAIVTTVIVCPNEDCKEYTIKATLHSACMTDQNNIINSAILFEWSMKPNSMAKQFPKYIPKAIIADYEEACLTKGLSPKASATLSRRCLQGIIRDFHSVKKSNLSKEINSIREKIDPTIWQAIDSVRKIGNISAHMEKDINLIIDVDPEEAQLLIGLIEFLIEDWYITRHKRQKHLTSIIDVADAKAEERNSNKSIQPTTKALAD